MFFGNIYTIKFKIFKIKSKYIKKCLFSNNSIWQILLMVSVFWGFGILAARYMLVPPVLKSSYEFDLWDKNLSHYRGRVRYTPAFTTKLTGENVWNNSQGMVGGLRSEQCKLWLYLDGSLFYNFGICWASTWIQVCI